MLLLKNSENKKLYISLFYHYIIHYICSLTFWYDLKLMSLIILYITCILWKLTITNCQLCHTSDRLYFRINDKICLISTFSLKIYIFCSEMCLFIVISDLVSYILFLDYYKKHQKTASQIVLNVGLYCVKNSGIYITFTKMFTSSTIN